MLDPDRYGLGTGQLDTSGVLYGAPETSMTTEQLTQYLQKVYCNTMALDLLCVEVSGNSYRSK